MSQTSDGWDKDQWREWISKQRIIRETIFVEDPDELIAAYNREYGYSRDYRGRELLELLQNADDAASTTSDRRCRVKIIIDQQCLFIANTGIPFSEHGVKSLIISNNSAKQYQRTLSIGNRGLGFRSILNLSQQPIIISGGLQLIFSEAHAHTWLQMIADRHTGIHERVMTHQALTQIVPIATLSVPFLLDEINDPSITAIAQSALHIQNDGFDTVIALPLTNPTAYTEVLRQVAELSKETMIFLRHITELTCQNMQNTTYWTIERADSLVALNDGDRTHYWTIHQTTDTLPEDVLDDHLHRQLPYELMIAVPENVSAIVLHPLFSYFRTRVAFPFPLLAHATVELSDTRESIARSNANAYILRHLAKLMVDVAVKHTETAHGWDAISLLVPVPSIEALDPFLREFGFLDALLTAMYERPLLPCYGGGWTTPREAILMHADPAWLPLSIFAQVTLWPDNPAIVQLLRKLKVRPITTDDLRQRINQHSTILSLHERIDLIVGLIQTNQLPTDPVPQLLINSNGTLVSESMVLFLPPDTRTTQLSLEIPAGLSIQIMHPILVEELRIKFGVSSNRELRAKLDGFPIQEYSFQTLLTRFVHQIDQDCRSCSDLVQQRLLVLNAISLIYRLYLIALHDDESRSDPQWPRTLRPIFLPSLSGSLEPASKLYLNRDYPKGVIVDSLYRSIHLGKLVASPEGLGLQDSIERIERFLIWLGVAEYPKTTNIEHIDCNEPFFRAIMCQQSYPMTIADVGTFDHYQAFTDAYFENVSTIDCLEDILAKGDSAAILAWISCDDRVDEWRKDLNLRLKVKTESQRSYRLVPRLKYQQSYIFWCLQTSVWLETNTGSRAAPHTCILRSSLPDALRELFPQPIWPHHALIDQEQFDTIDRQNSFTMVGVCPDLEAMPFTILYQKLLDYPRFDPEGIHARSFYRVLLKTISDGGQLDSPERTRFFTHGQLWGRRGQEKAYVPVSQMYYKDVKTPPSFITDQLWLLDCDPKRGAKAIERIFGVISVDTLNINIDITSVHPSRDAESLHQEIESLKPYLAMHRMTINRSDRDIERIKAFRVVFCHSFSGIATFQSQTMQITLDAASSWIFLEDRMTVYVLDTDEYASPFLNNHPFAVKLGNMVSTLLQSDIRDIVCTIATCQISHRLELVANQLEITIDEATRSLMSARELLEISMDDSLSTVPWASALKSVNPFPKPIATDSNPSAEIQSLHTDGITKSTASVSGVETEPQLSDKTIDGSVANISQLVIKSHEYQPSPKRTIALRISQPSGITTYERVQTTIIGGSYYEQLVCIFEESKERYPLPVSTITGSDGPGCDIVSFATEVNRQQFLVTHDLRLIQRFIEVKGSKHNDKTVDLTANELTAAKTYGERYYLYHLVGDELSLKLTIIHHPTDAPIDSITYQVNHGAIDSHWKLTITDEEH